MSIQQASCRGRARGQAAQSLRTGDVIELALFDYFVLEGVTSGADPSSWDPIDINGKE